MVINSWEAPRTGMSRTVLLTCALLISVAVVWVLVVSPTPANMIQAAVDSAIGVLVLVEIRNKARIHVFTQVTAVSYAVMSLWGSLIGVNISRFDIGMTLALLILISMVHIGTRPASHKSTYFLTGLTVAWAVLTIAIVDMPSRQEVGLLLLAIPGQILVVWLIRQIIRDLARTSEIEAKHARVQTAIAGCSQALLKRGGEHPLTEALDALLGATDADYAYVDVNRIHPLGHITWEIVAEAEGTNYPDRQGIWMSGDYQGLSEAEALLAAGLPAKVITADLEGPIRAHYEREGIKAELIAPIRISDRWIGTIGYTDFTRDEDWTDIEIEALMRAAEMVGAYWEREAAREGLMELATAKDRFIASVSHELRTPLAAVVGFAGELKRGKGDFSRQEIEEIATLIFTQSMEVSQLVDDLLTAERATTGNLTINPTDISLLQECRDVIEFTSGDREVKINGEDLTARADALRTRQILRNLFTNAIRYGGDTIEFEVSRRADKAVVRVKDNGVGVRTGDVERIFDPYYRVEGENTKPDSVGLGLAVARQLARLMDGDVVYQRSRGWTVFEFTVPLIAPEPDDELEADTLLHVS